MKKSKSFTPPPKKSIIIATCASLLALSLSGCSASSGPKDPVTSSSNPDLRCSTIEDFSSASKFWSWAYENIPTVTEKDIQSGKYDNTYVCYDAWAIGAITNGMVQVPFVVQNADDSYSRNDYYLLDGSSLKYGRDDIDNINRNDKIKFCIFISNGSYITDEAIAIKDLGKDSSFDVNAFLKEENEKEQKERKEREAAAQVQKDAITNPLMKEDLKTGTVYSGDKSKVLGSYGYISISKEVLKSITEEEFVEFAQEKVDNNPWYNWVSIICEDGTGICFSGCDIYYPSYGKLDTDGAITDGYGDITWDFNTNSYSYTPRQ